MMKKEKQKILLEIVEPFNRSNDVVIRKTEEDGSATYYHRLEQERGGGTGGEIEKYLFIQYFKRKF